MNNLPKMINRTSYVIAAISFIGSFILFFSQTAEWIGSLSAAMLAAALIWLGFVLMRWLILSLK